MAGLIQHDIEESVLACAA